MINTQDDRDAVAAKVKGSSIPVLLDDTHLVSESLQLTRAGEVLVIDPKGWKIAYRGPLDKAKAGNALLTGALDSVLAGQPVKKAQVAARGCAVKAAKATHAGAKVSYSEQIAPMLIDNCVTCHRTGGIGPWQMANYDTIKGFAPMIREVVRTKRMPPWHADPHIGVWDGDRSLSDRGEADAGALDRGRRAARQGSGSARRAAQDLERVGVRQARHGDRGAGVRHSGDRYRRLQALRGPEHAGPRRVGARDRHHSRRTHGRASRHRRRVRPEDRRRADAHDQGVQPVARRLRAGQRPDAVSAGHGRAGAQGPGLRVPDALHDLGQGGARRDAASACTSATRRRRTSSRPSRWRIRTSRFRRTRRSMPRRSRSSSRAT